MSIHPAQLRVGTDLAHDDHNSCSVAAATEGVDSWMRHELDAIPGLGDLTARYRSDCVGTEVRTRLIFLIARFGDGCNPQVVHVARLIELINLAATFHTEDVVEGAATGAATGAAPHRGLSRNSLAILSGDLILATSNQLATVLGPPAIDLVPELMERYFVGKLEAHGIDDLAPNSPRRVGLLRATTGSLFSVAARLSLAYSGAPNGLAQHTVEFAECLGIAVHLRDDASRLTKCAVSLGERTLAEAHRWCDKAVRSLTALPPGPVRWSLCAFAHSVGTRESPHY